jgi:hypothetical protein
MEQRKCKSVLLAFGLLSAVLILPVAALAGPTHFAVQSFADWSRALTPPPGQSMVRPMSTTEWAVYMMQYNDPMHLEGNPPYPSTMFLPPELYVHSCSGGGGGAGGCVEGGATDGLVMAWGDQTMPAGQYASAWVYQYGMDPDLSNSTVTIQVEPPCGMTQISVGIVDAAGLIRAWYWNVAAAGAPAGPGVLVCSPVGGVPARTNITIDLSKVGVAAASPVAFSYSNAPGFLITNVLSFTFDENFNWVPPTPPVPPPGQTDPKPWNYWFNLAVYPNGVTVNKGYYIKYSQPPVELEHGLINGWDVPSVEMMTPIAADDWKCLDNRPVTDIHWWGSFKGWKERGLPQVMPIAFRIGIWTDVPASPTNPFSHPGTMIWENYCTSWSWNFAGYDVDPRIGDPDYSPDEACFQFNQLLSEDEWFLQDPTTNSVYWLSIAAVYSTAGQVQYPWGWKTRPHFFNDDGVRIMATDIWPPVLGATYLHGMPIEYPAGVSWDFAFELTTNKPAYCDDPIVGDFNCDKIVNFLDFATFANNWLVIAP